MSENNRNNWRAAVQPGREGAKLRLGSDVVLEGQLVNVSAGGFAAQFPSSPQIVAGAEVELHTCDGAHIVRIQHVNREGSLVNLGLKRLRDLQPVAQVPQKTARKDRWHSALDVCSQPLVVGIAAWTGVLLVTYFGLTWAGAGILQTASKPSLPTYKYHFGWDTFVRGDKGTTGKNDRSDTGVSQSESAGKNLAQSVKTPAGIGTLSQQIEKTIEDYTAAIGKNPRDAGTWEKRGELWANDRKFDKALEDFAEALRLDPKSIDAYLGQARIWAMAPERQLRSGNQGVRALPLEVAALPRSTRRRPCRDWPIR
jgi:tetratricopeptide (TPR) repeat protein